jgi:hypothetical protein
VSQLKNIGASVHQRLKNVAKESGRSFNDLVQYYALERWLYRLSQSGHENLFILKGALMLVAWRAPILRATRDIDLLARTSNDLDEIKHIIAEICRTDVEDDGVWFDPESVSTTRIAEDADYEGVRATFTGRLATTRLSMQIDMGFSDVVTPGPVGISYPTILDYVPISDQLAAWLAPQVKKCGWICPRFTRESSMLRAFGRVRNLIPVRKVRNGHRHSYASYRMAEIGDLAKVSWDMGNSPMELKASYVSLAGRNDLAEWLSILPKKKEPRGKPKKKA